MWSFPPRLFLQLQCKVGNFIGTLCQKLTEKPPSPTVKHLPYEWRFKFLFSSLCQPLKCGFSIPGFFHRWSYFTCISLLQHCKYPQEAAQEELLKMPGSLGYHFPQVSASQSLLDSSTSQSHLHHTDPWLHQRAGALTLFSASLSKAITGNHFKFNRDTGFPDTCQQLKGNTSPAPFPANPKETGERQKPKLKQHRKPTEW